MPKLVYIAGPYTSETKVGIEQNVRAATEAGNKLLDHGLSPYVPHLSHYQHALQPRGYEDWMKLDFEWLKHCDSVLRLAGRFEWSGPGG